MRFIVALLVASLFLDKADYDEIEGVEENNNMVQ
jgi:hypothetical protein